MLAPELKVVTNSGGKKPSKTSANRLIYNAIKRFTLDSLNDLIRVLMENVDDAMFALSDKVDNDRERNMYFEAMREIRKKRESLQKSFAYEMQTCLEGFASKRSNADAYDEDDELTLVEFDELEDKIAIDNMIKRARPQFEDDLFALSERMKSLLQRKTIDPDENPLDPRSICEAFHSASEMLETEIRVKLLFYKLFEKYVMNNLGHFYLELNALFAKNGVLPDFSSDQERKRQTTRFMANRIRQSQQAAASAALAGIAAGGSAAADGGNLFAALQQAASGGAMAVSGGAAAGGRTGSGGTGIAGGGTGGAGGGTGGAGGGTGGAGGGTGSAGVGTGGAGGQVAGDAGVADGSGFIAALTSLQATEFPSEPLESIDPQSIKAINQRHLTMFRKQNQRHFSAADGQTMDVVSMLFDFFFDDDALPAPIKALIGRLQIPILKVAVLDREFFNHKKHPARKLLDSISRASLGWADNHKDEKELIDKTEEIVNFLVAEFEEDVSVFEEAYINFENFVTLENSKRKKTEAALLKQEQAKEVQIGAAREAAAALVDKLTRNRELSTEVTDFLETTWTSVLFNAYLSLGESSNHWCNLKRISTTFVWTLIPKHSEADRSKIIKTIPALLRALSKGMELIKISMDVQNRIFRLLAQEHAKIVKQTSRNIVTRVDDTTVWPVDSKARKIASEGEIDDGDITDIEFLSEAAESMIVEENEMDDDSITVIDATETNDVIRNLNQFTAGVKLGKIKVDEEIVLGSEDGDDFDLVEDSDEFATRARELEIGSWVEFDRGDSTVQVARLSWKSKVTGNFVFVNRRGHKVRNLSYGGFANELRSGRARCIKSSSVFDRAICTIASKIQH